jgi:hypothetical protein
MDGGARARGERSATGAISSAVRSESHNSYAPRSGLRAAGGADTVGMSMSLRARPGPRASFGGLGVRRLRLAAVPLPCVDLGWCAGLS